MILRLVVVFWTGGGVLSMALTLINSLRGYGGLCCVIGGGRGWDHCTFVFILKSASALWYFFMTSCNSMTIEAGLLESQEEQGPNLRPLTAARMTASSVMFGVRVLS